MLNEAIVEVTEHLRSRGLLKIDPGELPARVEVERVGMDGVLIDRAGRGDETRAITIRSLTELPALL